MRQEEFKTWVDFRAWIDNDRQVMPVYWRGQSNPSWPLASSFERKILALNGGTRLGASQIFPYDGRFDRNGKHTWSDDFIKNQRDGYLARFKMSAAGLRGKNPLELDVDQWWALGRHFGLITPLIDWTDSPYIAVFFTLTELLSEIITSSQMRFTGKQFAIYRLFHNPQLEGEGLRVVRPIVHELDRMHGQRGLFTWLDSDRYFELQGFLDNNARGDLLTKITVSNHAAMDGLRDLKAHGIDYRRLFPDLFGAAMHANTLWRIF